MLRLRGPVTGTLPATPHTDVGVPCVAVNDRFPRALTDVLALVVAVAHVGRVAEHRPNARHRPRPRERRHTTFVPVVGDDVVRITIEVTPVTLTDDRRFGLDNANLLVTALVPVGAAAELVDALFCPLHVRGALTYCLLFPLIGGPRGNRARHSAPRRGCQVESPSSDRVHGDIEIDDALKVFGEAQETVLMPGDDDRGTRGKHRFELRPYTPARR